MYQAIYKCRLCGEVISQGNIEGKDMELLISTMINCGTTIGVTKPKAFWKESSHNCQDGSFGLADFQGFKKSEG